MELGMGVLMWSPDQFWRATPREVVLAINGWSAARGRRSAKAMSRDRLAELMAKHPDTPRSPKPEAGSGGSLISGGPGFVKGPSENFM